MYVAYRRVCIHGRLIALVKAGSDSRDVEIVSLREGDVVIEHDEPER